MNNKTLVLKTLAKIAEAGDVIDVDFGKKKRGTKAPPPQTEIVPLTWRPLKNDEVGPGNILEIKEKYRKNKRRKLITVVWQDKNTKDFYYYYSDDLGRPLDPKRPFHSNMFSSYVFYKPIDLMKLDDHKLKGFEWNLTGDEDIDLRMANLDGRYQLFSKFAPQKAKELFEDLEDANDHDQAAMMVDEFAKHMEKGGKPEEFI